MILTIGHSTRTADEFLALLEAHGIEYLHLPGLGGLRKPRPDSPNGGWLNSAFRGYADHMQTPEFGVALDRLILFSADRQVAIMCAEAKWWQCHRRLIADALVARRIEVRHILSGREASPHELTPFGKVTGDTVQYPALV